MGGPRCETHYLAMDYASWKVRKRSMNDQMKPDFIISKIHTGIGPIPGISSVLSAKDLWGSFKARLGAGRMNYTVRPGLYAIGDPGKDSEILVSANYKLSFDSLRKWLIGRNFWILVLDTKGINVWCAAGKRTFGTKELVDKITETRLAEIVDHNRIILPQLAAPGVAAHKVKELTGFRVIYGPVLARDLPEFIDNGFKAAREMREKNFNFWERITLIPVELNVALKISLLVIILCALVGGLAGQAEFFQDAKKYGGMAFIWLIAAIVGGNLLTPALLPWIPGRAFSVKGLIPGLVSAAGAWYITHAIYPYWAWSVQVIAWFIITMTASSFLAMNFTGSSTYTSLSGVKKEMKYAVPIQIAAVSIAALLWVGSFFLV